MKNKCLIVLYAAFFMANLFICSPVKAEEWRFPVALSYANGFDDILDISEDNLRAEGYRTDSVDGLPVGVAFRPYFQFDNGFGLGADVGPAMMIFGDVDFFNIPVNVNCRYTPIFTQEAEPPRMRSQVGVWERVKNITDGVANPVRQVDLPRLFKKAPLIRFRSG